jgi:hypothetical protein
MRRISLWSDSQVPCHSSPSTQVMPVTKRFESRLRRIAPGLRIDLVDLALAMLPDPEAAFGPRHSGGAAFGRRDGPDHTAGVRINLLNEIAGDLVQVLAVEGGARMRGDKERANCFSARRIDRISACRQSRSRHWCRHS